MTITFKGEELILHPLKALYWPRQKMLLLADAHLGKAAHFRREGIPVPAAIQHHNLRNMDELIRQFQPERFVFLGDLFHSVHNESWGAFCKWLKKYPTISFELVVGNHDILSEEHYTAAGLLLHQEPYEMPPFLLSHHPQAEIVPDRYHLHGHLHPCVYLTGEGKQYQRLPCFHFGSYHGALPAFGAFTGMSRQYPLSGDRVFVLTEQQVFEV